MLSYQKLYHILFNAITDALEDLDAQNFGAAKARLITAQQETEELYMSAEEEEA